MPRRALDQLIWRPAIQAYAVEAAGVSLDITPETPAWFDWLDDSPSFAFQSRSGEAVTVRKEAVQRGGAYWYAYRRVHGRIVKRYLGRNADVSIARLEATITALQEPSVANGEPHAPSIVRAAHDDIHEARPSLLLTKLQAPRITTRLVSRPHVEQRLQRGLARPLTIIAAPAGFGKTTSLRAWLQQARLPIAWVSLDSGDNDVMQFWTYVLTALNTCYAGIADTALAMLAAPHPPPLATLMRALSNAIAARVDEVVLVLDDYHLITTPTIHESLALLLEHPPAQWHIYLATREEPPLPLARLRAHDQVNEIRADDLRFRPDEAAVFLAEVIGIQLAADDITTLSERADGWIAGLQLAGLSLQGHADPGRFVATFSGSHRHIMSYIGEEVLAAQPEEIQTFLLQTALLERMCAPLCDAMTQRQDGQSMLERLQRANLFLVPLDDEGCWYRYHHLFADLLRHRLHAHQGEEVPALHRRAAIWLEGEGWTNEAVDHRLAVPDLDGAARLIEQAAHPLLLRGEVGPVMHLLERVPENAILARPFLCLIHVHALLYRGNLVAAERRIAAAERFLLPMSDGTYALDAEQRSRLTAYLAIVGTTLPAMRGDADATIAQAETARGLMATITRDTLYNGDVLFVPLGIAYMTKGKLAAADTAFAEASRIGLTDGNLAHAALALMLRADVLMRQGRLHETDDLLRQIIQLVEAKVGAPRALACSVYTDLVSLLYERNDLVTARTMVDKVLALGQQWANDDDLVSGHIHLARIYQAEGEPDAAQAAMQQAERLFHRMVEANTIFPWLPPFVTASVARLALRQGHLAKAEQWAHANGYQDDLTMTQTLKHNQEFADATFARLLLAQGRFDPAARFLDRLMPMAVDEGRNGNVIEIAMLRALVWQAQGETEAALAALQAALLLAAPEGYVRIFIDEGAALRALLLRARDRQPKASFLHRYCDTLVAAFAPAVAPMPQVGSRQPLIEPLSNRECDVLRLLAAGRSNQEIARQLVVAVSTVKTHAHHLYAKLQAPDRFQAVLRARELGLLDA